MRIIERFAKTNNSILFCFILNLVSIRGCFVLMKYAVEKDRPMMPRTEKILKE